MPHYFRPFGIFRKSLDTQDFLILKTFFPEIFSVKQTTVLH